MVQNGFNAWVLSCVSVAELWNRLCSIKKKASGTEKEMQIQKTLPMHVKFSLILYLELLNAEYNDDSAADFCTACSLHVNKWTI